MRSLLVGLLFLVVGVGAAHAGKLTVSGQGEATAVPDMATMSMGVTQSADSPKEAMSLVTREINAVFAQLKDAGLPERDLQTSQISLYPIWSNPDRNGRTEVTGFTASVNMSVVLRDIDRLGDILVAVVDAGGNRFNGLNLGIQDTSALAAEARVAAIADARVKAEQYAAAAGVQLLEIVSISETGGGGGYPVARMADMAMSMESLEIARGESSVTQSVTVVFEFE